MNRVTLVWTSTISATMQPRRDLRGNAWNYRTWTPTLQCAVV